MTKNNPETKSLAQIVDDLVAEQGDLVEQLVKQGRTRRQAEALIKKAAEKTKRRLSR